MKPAKLPSKELGQHSLLFCTFTGLGLIATTNVFGAEYSCRRAAATRMLGARRRHLLRCRRPPTVLRPAIRSGCVGEPTTARVKSRFRRAEHRTPTELYVESPWTRAPSSGPNDVRQAGDLGHASSAQFRLFASLDGHRCRENRCPDSK